jgi:enoyl-CoA hydratase/carnithine racemase
MDIVNWTKDETVAIVTMNNGENRHSPVWTKRMLEVFDEITADLDIKALVLTSSDDKFWNLGIDTDWLTGNLERDDIQAVSSWFYDNQQVFRFLLMCPFPSIAAITGHAFGNGIMLAGACDFRFMRSDRGFLCLPEIDLGIQLTPSMIEWMKRIIPYHLFIKMKWSGDRIPAAELEKHNVIMKACENGVETVKAAVAYGKTFNKSRTTLAEMKRRTYKHIIDKMENEDPAYIGPPFFMMTR